MSFCFYFIGFVYRANQTPMTKKNVPVDPKLYAKIKAKAKSKFTVWPSAYASGWLVKEYKKAFAKEYGKSKSPYKESQKSSSKSNSTSIRSKKSTKSKSKGSLSRWFKEDWRNVCETDSRGNYKKCGRSKVSKSSSTGKISAKEYPYCRPKNRVSKDTPRTIGELSSREIERMCKKKRDAMTKRPKKQKSPSRVYLSGASVTRTRKVKKGKNYKEVRDYVSRKIPVLIREGYPQKQAIAIAFSMAEKKF